MEDKVLGVLSKIPCPARKHEAAGAAGQRRFSSLSQSLDKIRTR